MSRLILRDYQKNQIKTINDRLLRVNNILAVLATGGGKTVIFSEIIKQWQVPTCVIAHRKELIYQITLTLARNGIYHNIIAPRGVISDCVKIQLNELGKNYYRTNAKVYASSVDTLIRRDSSEWHHNIRLWIIDEAHHVLHNNKWGKVCARFKHAKGIGFTATPHRTDGWGLGRQACGVFDEIVEVITMQELIDQNYLTPFKIFVPPNDLHLEHVKISTVTGDYVEKYLRDEMQKSKIFGDVVHHYQQLAAGKRGLSFYTDVAAATEAAQLFNAANIPTACVSATTPPVERYNIINKFRKGEILQLTNCNLFSEGFDLPAIEIVSMANPTQSFSKYSQMIGRVLRPAPGKACGIIADHVGNAIKHGLPTDARDWSLDDHREKVGKSLNNPGLYICKYCSALFKTSLTTCPICQKEKIKMFVKKPEEIDGDLTEVDPDTLQDLRSKIIKKKDIEKYRKELINKHCPDRFIEMHVQNKKKENELREDLIRIIEKFYMIYNKNGTLQQGYTLFYYMLGVDVLTAQTLPYKETRELYEHAKKIVQE